MKVVYIEKPSLFFVEEHSLQELEQLLGVSAQALLSLNQKTQTWHGDILQVPKNNVYVVKPLDTIFSISSKLNISADELLAKNNTKNIFIGQMLFY
jgi:hypothetical protein